MSRMDARFQEMKDWIVGSERVLVGIGGEWSQNRDKGREEIVTPRPEVAAAYHSLYELIRETDYFLVTTVTDGEIWNTEFDKERIAAPCGNVGWVQCEAACTKDIWEAGEVDGGVCPHCGAALKPNTVRREPYIEEGYLPQWKRYTEWLGRTLNKRLTVLELGEGFAAPTVLRWPFEKTVFFNEKARMYRVHRQFSQISEELKDKAAGIAADSVEWIRQGERDDSDH